mmetsp:Transcript_11755/g.15497  ORF Transcript_11755/g.15497 Transcript_11755/m.15497 type:complete len:162 (-) Transcript_11755:885-1370(-)
MRKRIAFRKLSRTTAHKWAMLRNMVTSLIKHERIVTTVPKAKELKHIAEQMVTLAKKGTLHHRRQAERVVQEKAMTTKLFEVLGPRYQDRQGGYTRILQLSKRRKGDNAPMAVMEYVDRPGEIRAARPPKARRENLADVLREVGIEPLVEEELTVEGEDTK